MPTTPTLTVAELKSLLFANYLAQRSKSIKLNARIQQELGNKVVEEKPEMTAMLSKFAEQIFDVVAGRLARNQHTTPLFSSEDLVRFIPSMVDDCMRIDGVNLEMKERQMLESSLKESFESIVEMAGGLALPDMNRYQSYWRWVQVLYDLATERGVPPIELLALQEASDEITRRMLTKEQFVTLGKKMMSNKLMDVETIKKSIIQSDIDMLMDGDEEGLREIEQDFEKLVMPQLREMVAKMKALANTMLDEEVVRIYGAT